MKYTKFRIKHFKGINEVEIDLKNNRILTLVGLNESGKTTILESIDLYYKLIKGLEPDQVLLNDIRPKGINFTGKITIEAELEFDSEDKAKIVKHHKSLSKRTSLEIPNTFSYTFNFVYKTHKFEEIDKRCGFKVKTSNAKKTLHETDNKQWNALVQFVRNSLVPEVLFYEDFIFEIPEKIVFARGTQEQPVPEVSDKRNKEWQLVLSDILRAVDPEFKSFQEFVVDDWDTDNDSAGNRISSMEDLLNKKITDGWKELFRTKQGRGKKAIPKLNFKEIKLECTPAAGVLNVSFKVKNDSGKVFQINERSKGFKWFFSFLIFTEFRKNRTKNILFLLDEPASNLHSSAQQKILEAIQQLSDGSIVIYSTHSQYLIEPLWLNGAYVIINEAISDKSLQGEFTVDGEGHKIRALKYYDYVAKSGSSVKTVLFQPILDRLDYAPSQIEPTPSIAITEGKYDWYSYKYFYEILMGKSDLNFYPGAGCGQHEDIIRLYLSWGKKFVLMLDSDPAGQRAKNAYHKEFVGFVEDKVFSYEDMFDKGLVTENLITDPDKKVLLDKAFGDGTYEGVKNDADKLKSKLNFAINQLLVSKTKVKISKETSSNFRKLFKFLEEKINKQN